MRTFVWNSNDNPHLPITCLHTDDTTSHSSPSWGTGSRDSWQRDRSWMMPSNFYLNCQFCHPHYLHIHIWLSKDDVWQTTDNLYLFVSGLRSLLCWHYLTYWWHDTWTPPRLTAPCRGWLRRSGPGTGWTGWGEPAGRWRGGGGGSDTRHLVTRYRDNLARLLCT